MASVIGNLVLRSKKRRDCTAIPLVRDIRPQLSARSHDPFSIILGWAADNSWIDKNPVRVLPYPELKTVAAIPYAILMLVLATIGLRIG
jgi:hypothetical protein